MEKTNTQTFKIKKHTFEIFEQFMIFSHSGNCILSNDNILNMVELAVDYEVETLLQMCDNYLSKMSFGSILILNFYDRLSPFKESLPLFQATTKKVMEYYFE